MSKHSTVIRMSVVLVLVLLGTFLVVSNEKAARALLPQSGPTVSELTAVLIRTGLEPKALATAGVSPSAAATVVDNVLAYLVDNPGPLQSADLALAQAQNVCEELERVIQAGIATAQQLTDFNSAKGLRAQAQTDQANALQSVFAAGTANLSTSQKNILANVRANAKWELPVAYRTVERTEAQWVQLRDALDHERIALSDDTPVDADVQTLLSQVRSDSTVAMSISNLAVNLASVTSAWEQSISN
ncbi:MAG: hypothetical protein L0Y44_06495 [Phycisphaerales bacterium]|nr:hypothetical protein [Phycisphaerales bacterium]MCI0676402.1 hypothetical protein [Phycisphaerales bacterium]